MKEGWARDRVIKLEFTEHWERELCQKRLVPSWLGDCGQLILNPVAKKKRKEKQANKNEDVENRHVHTEGKRGGGTNGKSSTDVYAATCEQLASGKLLTAQGAQLSALQ